MATKTRHLARLLFLLLVAACTDGRIPKVDPIRLSTQVVTRTNVTELPDKAFQSLYNGQDIEVAQMLVKGSSLYLSGKPFGLMRADIGANAEKPAKIFRASETLDTTFPFGKWVFDWYGSRALAVLGQYVFTGGVVGTSVINATETNSPVEVRRYPRENEDPNAKTVVQDAAFSYRAMVAHPTQPILYGFREQDYVYTLNLSSGPALQLTHKQAYADGGTPKCCVRGATVWQNKVFVAFTSSLMWYDLSPDGSLQAGNEIKSLQAEAIASSPDYLFVYHNPGNSNPQGVANPRGIYVFNKQGDAVALLNTDAPLAMAATNDYVYINSDNTSLTVYKINWVK